MNRTTLNEGGNVFKDAEGNELTQRINRADVVPTVKWLEKLTGLPLVDNMLGTTGRKETSGDLDLAVDINEVSKDELVAALTKYVQSAGANPRDYIRKSGISVHFKTPISGRGSNGYVQTDFMFLKDVEFGKFFIAADPHSAYKGASRNIMLNSLGKALGYKVNQNIGLVDRNTNELVSKDPDEIAKLLLNPNAVRDDLLSVESIVAALKNDPMKDEKLKDVRDYFAREGIPFNESMSVLDNDSYFLARLRDKIYATGSGVLNEEQVLTEAVRIEHPEDLPFMQGSAGVSKAIAALHSMEGETEHVTIKWDGKPAIVFGRKENGDFVLTDKSGFLAKGYDGLATSPEMIASIMQKRGGDRRELINIYRKLFPLLEQSVPSSFRGYVQADLLYSNTPRVSNGRFEFTPNTITYEVDADSALGDRIAESDAAIAIHTYIKAPGEDAVPIKHIAKRLQHVPAMLVLDPYFTESPVVQISKDHAAALSRLSKLGSKIDAFLDPYQFKELKISNLPSLIKQYINSRVRDGHYENLASGFIGWLETASKQSPAKVQRITQYIAENKEGFIALIKAFLTISAVKSDLVRQLDKHSGSVHAHLAGEPGHEGYVADTQHGPIKLVDRMRFSAANFAKNNPGLD